MLLIAVTWMTVSVLAGGSWWAVAAGMRRAGLHYRRRLEAASPDEARTAGGAPAARAEPTALRRQVLPTT